jgi:hypothetical protein
LFVGVGAFQCANALKLKGCNIILAEAMNRSTIRLIILFIVLATVAYFLVFAPGNKERETSYKLSDFSVKVDSASVVKIIIRRPGKSITIENVSGRWMITSPINAIADPAIVKQILSGLMKFEIRSLVSSNPEKQNLFQVDSTGTNLEVIERSGKALNIIAGKMGPTFSEIYFRLPESNDVYLGEGIESWLINKELKEWRDKTIMVMPIDTIQTVTYQIGNKEYSFTRDSGGWQSSDKTVDANAINQMITSLSTMRAEDFVDTLTNFNTQPVVIQFYSKENITVKMYPVLPDTTKYYITSSLAPQIFMVSKWTAQPLLKPIQKSPK